MFDLQNALPPGQHVWWKLTTDQQFWWNWAVNLAMAVATFLAVFVALFAERLWRRWFPPLLKMRLLEPYGEKTIARSTLPNGTKIQSDVRFFHLRVWNERRRWSPANEAQVYLTSIEEVAPNGQYQVAWSGNVPMRWRDQEFKSLTQTVGANQDADLLMISKQDGVISLTPILAPNNLTVNRHGACRFVMRLHVRSNEADSEELRIQVSWDGVWEDGHLEMYQHFRVEELKER
jgi:hypothetical protein